MKYTQKYKDANQNFSSLFKCGIDRLQTVEQKLGKKNKLPNVTAVWGEVKLTNISLGNTLFSNSDVNKNMHRTTAFRSEDCVCFI